MKVYTPEHGIMIKEAIVKAILMARETNDVVETNINNVHLYTTPRADVDKMIRLFYLKRNMQIKMAALNNRQKQ